MSSSFFRIHHTQELEFPRFILLEQGRRTVCVSGAVLFRVRWIDVLGGA